jgi:hypothetical protein
MNLLDLNIFLYGISSELKREARSTDFPELLGAIIRILNGTANKTSEI